MFKFNEQGFNEVLISRGMLRKDLCEKIQMDPATLYRTINKRNGDFKLSDVNNIIAALDMTKEEVRKVFIDGKNY